MIKKIWRWIELWGLMYYAHGSEIVLSAFASVILATFIIGGLMYAMPEVFSKSNA